MINNKFTDKEIEYRKFTVNRILYSIGKTLKDYYRDLPIFINPNQQSTDVPCFFVQLIPSNNHLKKGLSNIDEYQLKIDIIYLVDYNQNDMYTHFYDIINDLDCLCDNVYFYTGTYNDKGEAIKNGTFGIHNRQYTTELGKLSYRFDINLRVKKIDIDLNDSFDKLNQLIYNLNIKTSEKQMRKEDYTTYVSKV